MPDDDDDDDDDLVPCEALLGTALFAAGLFAVAAMPYALGALRTAVLGEQALGEEELARGLWTRGLPWVPHAVAAVLAFYVRDFLWRWRRAVGVPLVLLAAPHLLALVHKAVHFVGVRLHSGAWDLAHEFTTQHDDAFMEMASRAGVDRVFVNYGYWSTRGFALDAANWYFGTWLCARYVAFALPLVALFYAMRGVYVGGRAVAVRVKRALRPAPPRR